MGKISNKTKNINSQCKVVVYNWSTQSLKKGASDSSLSNSKPIDISSRIQGVTFTKSMRSPSGSFSIKVANNSGVGTGDWKDLIKRGTWCVIYMSQDGDLKMKKELKKPSYTSPKKVRCIGFIERVSVSSELNDAGAFDVTYDIAGRDFGVIYEDAVVWHNLFKYEKIALEAASSTLNVVAKVPLNEVLQTVHDLFYNPNAVAGAKGGFSSLGSDKNSITEIARQWLLPRAMIQDLKLGSITAGSGFWGDLKNTINFEETKAGISVSSPIDYLSGNVWQKLKKLSIPQFHELYTEINYQGVPQLNFRPIPWALNSSKYPLLSSSITKYKDVPFITCPALDVIQFNLGEDNHNRYNSFLVTIDTGLINSVDNIAALKNSDFPFTNDASVKRNGFRAMHVTINSMIQNSAASDGKPDSIILKNYNELLKDYWNNAVFAENGTLERIGSNDVKVGVCLEFDKDTPYASGRRYYIEEYTDVFSVDDKGAGLWTQELKITRGFEKKDLQSGRGFGSRDTAFKHEGEFTGDN